MKRATGFTLIELLTVIGVITILAAALLPNLLAARQRAHESSAQIYARQTVNIVETKKDNATGKIPPIADCTDTSQGFKQPPAAVSACSVTPINDDLDYRITLTLNRALTRYSKLEYDSSTDRYTLQ